MSTQYFPLSPDLVAAIQETEAAVYGQLNTSVKAYGIKSGFEEFFTGSELTTDHRLGRRDATQWMNMFMTIR